MIAYFYLHISCSSQPIGGGHRDDLPPLSLELSGKLHVEGGLKVDDVHQLLHLALHVPDVLLKVAPFLCHLLLSLHVAYQKTAFNNNYFKKNLFEKANFKALKVTMQ